MMLPPGTLLRAAVVLDRFRALGWRVATAESCTGGLIAAALTHVAGSSDVVDRGYVTYSNDAKTELLGVPVALISAVGAVSRDVAAVMAEGALARAGVDVAVAVTGIAGPAGGSADKPVGLVWFALAREGAAVITESHVFPGDRAAVRAATVAMALDLLENAAMGQQIAKR